MKLSDYQRLSQETDQTPKGSPDTRESALLIPLLGLAGEAGQLLAEYKKHLRDGPSHERFSDHVAEELGDILWYAANLATKYNLDLDELAEQNLRKTRKRYLESKVACPIYDGVFNEAERFPDRFVLELTETSIGGNSFVKVFHNGDQIGATLTDNAYESDGYRFHDVFHMSYASILGWSPVLRSTMKRKRKSVPKVDEVEDGGRAAVIEEGIAALVFDYARRHAFLEGVTDVDDRLLNMICGMSEHLEVSTAEPWQWRKAIIEGFKVWREVMKNRGGFVEADLTRNSISYLGPSAEKAIATAPTAASE
ncbi:nucleoside triphosphate pyrophosphohydrolase family protein [Tardiphaga sp. 1201_B9_N1_1]|uniref:nucleoside triphosphate pyrophosphohydrolase family protein n=1 Tax=unclassified Tardiphaga TaxID=2631404 RepID=UPI003F232B7B